MRLETWDKRHGTCDTRHGTRDMGHGKCVAMVTAQCQGLTGKLFGYGCEMCAGSECTVSAFVRLLANTVF